MERTIIIYLLILGKGKQEEKKKFRNICFSETKTCYYLGLIEEAMQTIAWQKHALVMEESLSLNQYGSFILEVSILHKHNTICHGKAFVLIKAWIANN